MKITYLASTNLWLQRIEDKIILNSEKKNNKLCNNRDHSPSTEAPCCRWKKPMFKGLMWTPVTVSGEYFSLLLMDVSLKYLFFKKILRQLTE
ncbi:hypothetical protein RUM43_012591 [Polyplax serrata]|uniref:Uncharacterized protein n=1 Tax=Polyplax serrata TaxID=468196 RepID=A0AAN8P5C3_POLSC